MRLPHVSEKLHKNAEKISNFTKLLTNSNIPDRPNLFFALDNIEIRLSFGRSLSGAITNDFWIRITSITVDAGTANQGEVNQIICVIKAPKIGALPPLKKSADNEDALARILAKTEVRPEKKNQPVDKAANENPA